MKVIKHEQFLPITLEKAWEFFSSPKNLNEITPSDMSFKILTDLPEKMYEGMMIRYIVSPFLNIPMEWVTEISHINERAFFVDEQRKGPFSIWHHEHHFKAVDGGVLMTDILHYDIGKSVFGWIAGKLFVHKNVANIFKYRAEVIEKRFRSEH
jgi:ligand-binding SRPBCC domain-containing protein